MSLLKDDMRVFILLLDKVVHDVSSANNENFTRFEEFAIIIYITQEQKGSQNRTLGYNTHMRARTNAHTRPRACMHTHIHILYIYMYIYIYIHTHTKPMTKYELCWYARASERSRNVYFLVSKSDIFVYDLFMVIASPSAIIVRIAS